MPFSILIVDDSLPMRGIIKKTLRSAGYGASVFLEARDGERALETLGSSSVDLVITDFTMPVMNGLELISRMKARDDLRDVPVIVVTSEGSRQRIDEFKEKGASGYITKPFSPEQLRDVLLDIIGESHYETESDDPGGEFDF